MSIQVQLLLQTQCLTTRGHLEDNARSKFHALVQTLMLPVYQQIFLVGGRRFQASPAWPGQWRTLETTLFLSREVSGNMWYGLSWTFLGKWWGPLILPGNKLEKHLGSTLGWTPGARRDDSQAWAWKLRLVKTFRIGLIPKENKFVGVCVL
jgi:hypothetical protein